MMEKQNIFSTLCAHLILKAQEMNYIVTLGEAWRSDETAELYAKEGKGISNSLHRLRLAIDLNLFRNGLFLNRTEDYKPLGEWWESQSNTEIKCSWGGRFDDANHFSLEHEGVR